MALGGCVAGGPASRDADDQFAHGSDRPPSAATLYASAQLLTARGRDDEAFWVYQRINRDYPKYGPAYCGVAEYHMRRNHLSEASAALKAGLAKSPDDPVLLNNLGMVQMMQTDYENALANFTKAASLTPGNARYRSNMGAALGMMGRYDESVAVYQQVVQENDAHYNVGVLADARGDKARAEQEFEIAAKGPPPKEKPKEEKKGTKAAAPGAVKSEPAVGMPAK
jgi:Flp pilus assembly protein TadD